MQALDGSKSHAAITTDYEMDVDLTELSSDEEDSDAQSTTLVDEILAEDAIEDKEAECSQLVPNYEMDVDLTELSSDEEDSDAQSTTLVDEILAEDAIEDKEAECSTST
ncbi:hypothetical protein CF319_g634 [Tilletia indica]|nr:hypothetical protein CF319_g634 [Tilletia indica]